MAISTAHEFVTMLEKSRVLTSQQLAELRMRAPAVEDNPRPMIDALIQRKLLTRWQVNQILSGQPCLYVGKYKLLDKIGAGGMGTVYKAEHVQMGRVVALKLISKELLSRPDSVARFRREVQMAASLHHPNIVTAYDADEVRGRQFLVMEYVEGHNLTDWTKQHGRLPIDWASECIRQAAIGLEYAHRKGMVHRDIKPSNLLVMSSDTTGVPVVKILDMGLARSASEEHAGEELTQHDQVLGTPDYMAPEQADDSRSADIRADIYSLGCTFYKLLTGYVPFPGKNALEKLKAAMVLDTPRVSKLRPEIPPLLDSIIARMMARDPAERFQTPGELARALEPFASGTAGASEESSSIMLCSETHVWSPSQAHGDSALQDFLSALSNVPDQNTPAMGHSRTQVEPLTPAVTKKPAPARRKSTQDKKSMLMIAAAGTVVLLAIATWFGTRPQSARLKVQWPLNERDGATFTINGRPQMLTPDDPLEIELLPGTHKLYLARRTYEPIRAEKSVDKGDEWVVVPKWKKIELSPPTIKPIVPARAVAETMDLTSKWIAAQTKRQKELATELEQRLQEFGTIKKDLEQQAAQATAEQSAALRAKVLDFRTRWYGTEEAGQAAALLMKLPAAADALDRKKIAQHELVAAGDGNAAQAPKELAWVFGDGRLKHDSKVSHVAFSPDGTIAAVGTEKGLIDLWEPRTGQLIRELKGAHTSWVRGLAFSPDGRWLASTSDDGSVQLWEAGTGQQSFRFGGHRGRVRAVAFSRDGKLLATGSQDQTVRVWDTRIGDLVHELKGHTAEIWSVAFSPKEDLLASGSADNTARIWDPTSGEAKHVLAGHTSHVYGVAFPTGGNRIATAGNDGLLKLWTTTGEELFNLTWDGGGLLYLAASPQGDLLAAGNTAKLWVRSAIDGKSQLKLDMTGMQAAAFSADGGALGVCAFSALKLFDVRSGELRLPGPSHASPPRGMVFAANGATLYSTGSDESLQAWDVARGQRKFEQKTKSGEALAMSPDGQLLAMVSSADAAVRVVDTASGQERMVLTGHTNNNYAAAFSPDNKFLATGGQDLAIRIWDLAARTQIAQLDTPQQQIRALVYGLDGTLYAGYVDGQIVAWNVAGKQPSLSLAAHNTGVTCLALHPTGRYLASGSTDDSVKVWDLQTVEAIQALPIAGNNLHDVVFGLDGQTLMATSTEWTIRFWDFRAGKQLRVLKLADLQPFRLALSPEGRYLAVGLRNGCIDLLKIADR